MEGRTKRSHDCGQGLPVPGPHDNLFDGVSFVVEANEGNCTAGGVKDKCADAGDINTWEAKTGEVKAGEVRAERTQSALARAVSCCGAKVVFALEGSEHGREDMDLALDLAAGRGLR